MVFPAELGSEGNPENLYNGLRPGISVYVLLKTRGLLLLIQKVYSPVALDAALRVLI